MILQALYRLAQDEHLVPDPDFEDKPVGWLAYVDADGRLLSIAGTHTAAQEEAGSRRRKTDAQPRTYRIPRQNPKRSGTKPPPEFFVDNALYVFSCDVRKKPFPREKARERSEWFRQLVAACVRETQDEGAVAVLRLLVTVHGLLAGQAHKEPDESRVPLPQNAGQDSTKQ